MHHFSIYSFYFIRESFVWNNFLSLFLLFISLSFSPSLISASTTFFFLSTHLLFSLSLSIFLSLSLSLSLSLPLSLSLSLLFTYYFHMCTYNMFFPQVTALFFIVWLHSSTKSISRTILSSKEISSTFEFFCQKPSMQQQSPLLQLQHFYLTFTNL